MSRKIYRILTRGGLGDILLATPALKALKEKYPTCKIKVLCDNRKEVREIFQNNPYISSAETISLFTTPYEYLLWGSRWGMRKLKLHDFSYGDLYPCLFGTKSAKDLIAEEGYEVELSDRKIQLFLAEEEEKKAKELLSGYKNPVIMHIKSRTSKNQEWPLRNWDELVRSMPECSFIQLGWGDEDKVEQAVDLRGKTSFRESFALIKYAKGFVGINSALSHVTNAFDIPGVVLFGPGPPIIWGHPNNINLYKPVRCAPCLDLLSGNPCPYGKPCMTNITVEDVRSAILSQLNKAKDNA
jgi:ADP-heptose:LPS heptosyltransferase